LRVRIHENEPIAHRRRGAGVAGASNLIDRFKDDVRAFFARERGGKVGRVVIADNDFRLPSEFVKALASAFDGAQSLDNEFLLIVGGDNNRDFHTTASN
jgi:hypothetical protein